MKPTPNNLKKLKELFSEMEYTIRFEKGNFQSGYCLVENKKIIIINRFFDTEAKMNCLLDILSQIMVDRELLSENSLKLYKKILASFKANSDTEQQKLF